MREEMRRFQLKYQERCGALVWACSWFFCLVDLTPRCPLRPSSGSVSLFKPPPPPGPSILRRRAPVLIPGCVTALSREIGVVAIVLYLLSSVQIIMLLCPTMRRGIAVGGIVEWRTVSLALQCIEAVSSTVSASSAPG